MPKKSSIDPTQLVLYEDASLLAVNKPAGVPVLPDGYDLDLVHLRALLEPAYGPLWIVHRLDKETSGLVMLARTAEAHRALNDSFAQRQVSKIYHALVRGAPDWTERVVRLALLPDGDRRHRTVVDRRRGKRSLTRLRVLEQFRGYALVEAAPKTGRTHQIRVHLQSQGVPIAADPLYGDGRAVLLSEVKPGYRKKGQERPLLDRLGLHAWQIVIPHPVHGEPLSLRAPHPKDLRITLRQLRKYGR